MPRSFRGALCDPNASNGSWKRADEVLEGAQKLAVGAFCGQGSFATHFASCRCAQAC